MVFKLYSIIFNILHFVGNGNILSISSWLTTEIQVCQNVGRPNPRPTNLVIPTILNSQVGKYSKNTRYYFIFLVFFFSSIDIDFFSIDVSTCAVKGIMLRGSC